MEGLEGGEGGDTHAQVSQVIAWQKDEIGKQQRTIDVVDTWYLA